MHLIKVALKGALEVVLELSLWSHLLIQSLIHKCAQSNSSNNGPDAALEGTFHGEVNVKLESIP